MPKNFPFVLDHKSEGRNSGIAHDDAHEKSKAAPLLRRITRTPSIEVASMSPIVKEEWQQIVLKPTKKIQRTISQEEREEVYLKPVLKAIRIRDGYAPGEIEELLPPEEEEPEEVKVPEKLKKPLRKRHSIVHNENSIDSKEPEKLVWKPAVLPQKAEIIELPVIEEVKEYKKSDQYFKIVVQEGPPFRFIPVREPTEEDLEIWDDDVLVDISLTDADALPKYYLKHRQSGLFTFKPIPKRINRIRKNQLGEDILEFQDISIFDEKEASELFQEFVQNGKPSIFQPSTIDSQPKKGRRKGSLQSKEVYKSEPVKYYEKRTEGGEPTFVEIEKPSIEETTQHVRDWGIEAPLYYTKWTEPGGLVIFHPIPRVGKRTKRDKATRNRRTEVIEIKTTYEGIDGQHFVEKLERVGRVTYEAVPSNLRRRMKKRKSDAKKP